LGAHIGAARLLYGMGRSNALPKSFFGAVDAKHRIPRNNVIFVGGFALLGAFLLEFVAGYKSYVSGAGMTHFETLMKVANGDRAYGLGAEMLNFGALIAFMGVNAAAFTRYYLRADEKKLTHLIPPVLGFVICLALWLNLSHPAKLAGSIWMIAGIAFGVWRTRGFRTPMSFDVPEE
jgi:putrescine importer